MEKSILILVATFLSNLTFSQDLKKHQWNNRLVLVISNSFENELLQQQNSFFSEFAQEMKERKLLQYEITPDYYRVHTDTSIVKMGTSTVYDRYKKKYEPYTVIIIGLDGKVKLEKNQPVPISEVFELIDQMPIRTNEIQNR